jgi:hypothetical protein
MFWLRLWTFCLHHNYDFEIGRIIESCGAGNMLCREGTNHFITFYFIIIILWRGWGWVLWNFSRTCRCALAPDVRRGKWSVSRNENWQGKPTLSEGACSSVTSLSTDQVVCYNASNFTDACYIPYLTTGFDFDNRYRYVDFHKNLVFGNSGFKLFMGIRYSSITVNYLVWERVDSRWRYSNVFLSNGRIILGAKNIRWREYPCIVLGNM